MSSVTANGLAADPPQRSSAGRLDTPLPSPSAPRVAGARGGEAGGSWAGAEREALNVGLDGSGIRPSEFEVAPRGLPALPSHSVPKHSVSGFLQRSLTHLAGNRRLLHFFPLLLQSQPSVSSEINPAVSATSSPPPGALVSDVENECARNKPLSVSTRQSSLFCLLRSFHKRRFSSCSKCKFSLSLGGRSGLLMPD